MKKIFSFAALFAAMSLVACGSEQKSAEENAEETVVEVVEEVAAPAPAPVAKENKAPEKADEPQKLVVSDKVAAPAPAPAPAPVVTADKDENFKATKEVKKFEGEVKTFEGATNAKATIKTPTKQVDNKFTVSDQTMSVSTNK